MSGRRGPGAALLVIGVVFVAVGSSGQRAFLATGLAFLAVGVVLLLRARSGTGPGGGPGGGR
jgi:hypothetical protein